MEGCWASRIDWPAVYGLLQGLGGIMQGLAGVALAWFGWKGLEGWREQLVSKRKQEVAEEVLALTYEVSDAMTQLRAPVAWPDELDRVPKRDGQSQEEYEAVRHYGVIEVRFAAEREHFAKFEAMRGRVAAIFGVELRAKMDELLSILRMIRSAPSQILLLTRARDREAAAFERKVALGLVDSEEAGRLHEAADRWQRKIDSYSEIMYLGLAGEDATAKEQREAVAAMESHLQRYAQMER